MFIDKVRHLEQQNKGLEMELASLRQKQSDPSRVAQLYQQELRDLRSQVEELSRDKSRFLIERNNVEDEFQVKRARNWLDTSQSSCHFHPYRTCNGRGSMQSTKKR